MAPSNRRMSGMQLRWCPSAGGVEGMQGPQRSAGLLLTCLSRVDSGTARITAPGGQWGGPGVGGLE